ELVEVVVVVATTLEARGDPLQPEPISGVDAGQRFENRIVAARVTAEFLRERARQAEHVGVVHLLRRQVRLGVELRCSDAGSQQQCGSDDRPAYVARRHWLLPSAPMATARANGCR